MKLILSALFSIAVFAQVSVPRYMAVKETVLAGAAEKITIQQPTGSTSQVSFEQADIYSSVDAQVTIYWNGTAATVTALTPVVISGPTTGTLAFSGSDVGTGNTGKKYFIPAGATLSLDISAFYLPRGAGNTANFSIGTNSITGTVRIQIQWKEEPR